MNVKKKSYFLLSTTIETPLGNMLAIADETSLYLLEFETRRKLAQQFERLKILRYSINKGMNPILELIETELKAYFCGNLTHFTTPYRIFGSHFQQQVWSALCKIPFGVTKSYAEQAALLGKPSAYRAVANANGANQLAIIIPCHRIIASNGALGGYGGGVSNKQWLLDHEKANCE